MKFKTVSEFIHALEVEGKKFEHPDSYPHFVAWGDGRAIARLKAPSNESWDFTMWSKILTHDWQEYQPWIEEIELETEEIELVEWMRRSSLQHTECSYYVDWLPVGAEHNFADAFKTGVTRKVKVPK